MPTADLPLVSNIRKRLTTHDEDFLALVLDLLAFNPDLRPTAFEALNQMFFNKKYPQGPPCRMVDSVIIQDEESSDSEPESGPTDCDSVSFVVIALIGHNGIKAVLLAISTPYQDNTQQIFLLCDCVEIVCL